MEKTTLNCSNCNAKLIDLVPMDKNVHVNHTFVAECPHCGDRSFPAEAKGDIAISGTEFTSWVDSKEEFHPKLNKNVYILVTKKGAKKPRVRT